MENRPHYIWAFVVVAIVGVVAWIYSANRPDQESFAKGSMKVETHDTYWPFAISIGQGSCARIPQERNNAKSIKPLTNSVSK